MNRRSLALIGTCLSLLSACADQQTTRTGFLNSYDQMQQHSENALSFGTTHTPQTYASFMVDDVHYAQGPHGEELDAEQITAVKDAYKKAIVASFSKYYRLTDAPGHGVMRVRPSVTGVSTAVVPLNYVSTLAVFTPVSNGGVSTESEVADSVTGSRLAALSTHTNPDIFDGEFLGYFTQTGHARSTVEAHADQLRDLLRAHQ